MTVATSKTEKQLHLSSVKGIKTRKFSVLKTAALVSVVILAVPIINYLLNPQLNLDFGNSNPN
jgi:hypothetical protein